MIIRKDSFDEITEEIKKLVANAIAELQTVSAVAPGAKQGNGSGLPLASRWLSCLLNESHKSRWDRIPRIITERLKLIVERSIVTSVGNVLANIPANRASNYVELT